MLTEDLKSITGASDSAEYGFGYTYTKVPEPSFLETLLPYLIPLALVMLVFYFIMRQQQGNGNKALSFGKSRARMQVGDKNRKTFADVAGADEEKAELAEIVEFLEKTPSGLSRWARAFPRACCWWGLRAAARRCSPKRWPGRPACRSSR